MKRIQIVMRLFVIGALAIANQAVGVETIKGRVTEASTDSVKITTDSEWVPVTGDPVEIYFELPGIEEGASVARGKVTEVTGDAIVANIERKFSQAERGHLARIVSEKPQKRTTSAGSTPPPPAGPSIASSPPVSAGLPAISPPPVPPGPPSVGAPTPAPPAGDRAARLQHAVERVWKNDLRGALDEFNQLAASDPNDFEARRLRGLTALALGEVRAARADAEALLAQRPNDPSALILHGQTALWDKDTATARRDFERVVRLAPGTVTENYNQANQMLDAGVLSVAYIQYHIVLNLDPRAYGAHYGLGVACMRLGYREEAIRSFEIYLRTDSTSPYANQARQHVQRLRASP